MDTGGLHNDADFQRLLEITSTASFFSILGKTQKERYHSGFLGWLLNPQGTHGLGNEPLRLFIKAINNACLKPSIDHPAICPAKLAESNVLSEIDVDPNEFSPKEANISGVGELDCFIRGTIESGESFAIVVEQKTTSHFHEGQCQTYGNWLLSDDRWDIRVPVVLIPNWRIGKSIEQTCSDGRWCAITYEILYDCVLSPLLQREDLKAKTRVFLEDYELSLRTPVDGRSLIRDIELEQLIHGLKARYPQEMREYESLHKTTVSSKSQGTSNKLYYLSIDIGNEEPEEFEGNRQDIFQGVVKLVADNYPLFEAAGLELPYALDRGTGRPSNRMLLSLNKNDIEGPVAAEIDTERTLYMSSAISSQPRNVQRSIATLIKKVGWEVESFSP